MVEHEDTKNDQPPWQFTVVSAVFATWAIVHAIRNRSLEDFLRYPIYIATPIAAVAAIWLAVGWWRAGFRKPTAEETMLTIASPLLFLSAGVIYYAFAVGIKDGYLWMQSPRLPRTGAVAVGLAITLVVGFGLFYFRFRFRSLYGVTEALVGLTVAGHRISADYATALSDSTFYLAVLTAGVYLIVRGLDNVHQGLRKEPFDPIATRLEKWLASLSPPARDADEAPPTSSALA